MVEPFSQAINVKHLPNNLILHYHEEPTVWRGKGDFHLPSLSELHICMTLFFIIDIDMLSTDSIEGALRSELRIHQAFFY